MSEKLLQAILDELKSINSKLANMDDVVEIISGKMNDTEEQLDTIIKNTKELESSVDGVRSDISDLQRKVINEMPSLDNIEYSLDGSGLYSISDTLKKIEVNTR